ncbi:MaoC family dehydratase [Ramlibacter henchirensis]|uniref:MaoC family dehydratase n=1 Tax=Ramlibacter henchirensis TaxID=204072 RepID=A0A4Z0C972_9BURK|nr:MaoC family dehydratase [Ramlibacter henchirensis]TFZ06950.1 MaoC family dehydratase [Ramlibacter henchirensis]
MAIRWYWEDLQPGSVRDLGSITPTAQEIRDFAAKFDPQPFHLDEEAGRRSVFGGLCASGWHTCSMAMRLTVDNFLRESSSMGSPGLENIRWMKPVYPGDTLTLKHRTLESRPLNSRPEIGLVRAVWEMFNQRGEQVLHMEGYGMFKRRTPAAPAAPAST